MKPERARVAGLVGVQLEEEVRVHSRTVDPNELSATVDHVGVPLTDGRREVSDRTIAVGERYRILRLLATGGMGKVYVALDSELDRQVALKVFQADVSQHELSQLRFLLEAKVTGRLDHPGIVPVYGIGRNAEGRPYYAMKLIEGETLQDAIERFHAPESSVARPVIVSWPSAGYCAA